MKKMGLGYENGIDDFSFTLRKQKIVYPAIPWDTDKMYTAESSNMKKNLYLHN